MMGANNDQVSVIYLYKFPVTATSPYISAVTWRVTEQGAGYPLAHKRSHSVFD